MRELKLISRLPKLSIIQAQGANPFYRSVREFGGKKLEPMTADTLATAIRIGNPASWKKALRVLAQPAARSNRSRKSKSPLPKPKSAPMASVANLPPPSRWLD